MIPLAKPNISDSAIEKVINVIHSGMLVQGKEVLAFEEKVAKYLRVNHAICVSSGTAALHLSLIAAGIGPGDEVIIPAFSFIATANTVELVGAKPVFVDIDLETFNINADGIEKSITSTTKAIIPVHEFGLSAEIIKIKAIANKNDIIVIEDAACALGANEEGKMTGSFGEFGAFSLHPRKAITSGEGGIVTTNDGNRAEKIRILRNHGIRYSEGEMDFVEVGFNYRITDMQAALVSSQFDELEARIRKRQHLAEIYLNEIKNDKVKVPFLPTGRNHTWQTFHILLKNELERTKLRSYLKGEGISTNYGAQCIPHMSYYRRTYKHNSIVDFPNAYKAYTCGLAIPLFDQLTEEEIRFIIQAVNNFK